MVAVKPKPRFEQLWAVDFRLVFHEGNPQKTPWPFNKQCAFHLSLAGFVLAFLQARMILTSSVFVP